MKKTKLLFFLRGYNLNAPHEIRMRYIIKHLSNDYDIDVLTFRYPGDNSYEFVNNMYILEYSFFSKIIYRDIFFPVLNKVIYKYFFKTINYIAKKIIFPDFLALEKNKILNKILSLHSKSKYSCIIGAAYPFTVFEIGKLLKIEMPDINWVLDMGDPFAKNSALCLKGTKYIKASKYEENNLQYADGIVVTNSNTVLALQEQYKSLKSTKFFVIPQAVEILKVKNDIKKENSDIIRLIYAGIFYKNLREPFKLFSAMSFLGENFILDIYGQKNVYNDLSSNIKFNGSVKNELIFSEYENSDILVFIDNAYGVQTSGKIYELVSMKRPILFIYDNLDSPLKLLLSTYNFVFFTKNNTKDIILTVNNIINDDSQLIYNYDLESISWSNRAILYSSAINSILK